MMMMRRRLVTTQHIDILGMDLMTQDKFPPRLVHQIVWWGLVVPLMVMIITATFNFFPVKVPVAVTG